MQQYQGTFASQVNQAQAETGVRMANIESTIRDREEAIRIEFDRTAAQRAAQLASVIGDAKTEFEKATTTTARNHRRCAT